MFQTIKLAIYIDGTIVKTVFLNCIRVTLKTNLFKIMFTTNTISKRIAYFKGMGLLISIRSNKLLVVFYGKWYFILALIFLLIAKNVF
ncbi:MAG TPA: hypothetical protein DHW64_06360 [Chitinophagaceae bacterium]|nr:hypothetical protein [Chitinophagaceae bacterium]